MASTDTACAPVHEDDDATGRNINTFPSDQLAQHRDDLIAAYVKIRAATEAIAYPLLAEQQSIQSMPDASPVKWHRAHTSWFFETFLLQHYKKRFDWHNVEFCYLFNSYYNGIGKQYPRAERGRMAHPDCEEITAYRSTVDQRMEQMLAGVTDHELGEMAAMLVLGLNHEQQHQELMLTDYQHALSVAPATAPPPPTATIARPLAISFSVNRELAIFKGCISNGLTANTPNLILWVTIAAGTRLKKQSHLL